MANQQTFTALRAWGKLAQQVRDCNCSHCRWLIEQAFPDTITMPTIETCCFAGCGLPATHKEGGEVYFPTCDEHHAQVGV